MSDNFTPGQTSDRIGEIKYLSIAKVTEGHLLLTLPTVNTKKAYAEEVTTIEGHLVDILC